MKVISFQDIDQKKTIEIGHLSFWLFLFIFPNNHMLNVCLYMLEHAEPFKLKAVSFWKLSMTLRELCKHFDKFRSKENLSVWK